MPKPRTNADTIERWADSILEREPSPSYEVNSIIVQNDVVFSFGSHWPMGVIERAPSGKVRRVYLNSDHCASMGFANTNGDQWTATAAARAACAKVGAEIISRPMGTGWWLSGDGMIQCRPNPSDPRPPSDWSCEIPTVFHATDPGPEPVDDGVGCIVGQREEYSYTSRWYAFADPELRCDDQAYVAANPGDYMLRNVTPGAWTYWKVCEDRSGRNLHSEHAHNGVITYREPKTWETWTYCREPKTWETGGGHDRATENKICPHCLAFAKLHARWREAYEGPFWGRNRGKGWRLYSEMMERFGSSEEWREQRLVEFRRVREGRKTFAAWRERNYMPVSSLPAQGKGSLGYVPRLDREGYPLRKDSEAYFRAQRAADRRKRRAEREHEAQVRYERQVERFARGMRNRRRTTFTQRAANIAAELRQVREALESTTDEVH